MPELPEVHTIVTDLNRYISGYKILSVVINSSYKTIPNNPVFKKAVMEKSITEVTRIAKNIILKLSSGNYILIHLAMTGRVLLRKPADKPDGWVCVVLKLERDDDTKELRFTDVRKFGKMGVIGEKAFQGLVNKYGPEPLNVNLTPKQFLEIIKSKKTNIKNVLLDQNLISGLGNIYTTDALFLSGINPQTQTSKITLNMANKLLGSAKLVLQEGIKNRGSTLPDKAYVDIFGKEGSQQKYFKIYMKEKCPKCNLGVKFIKINGRGTYFCENCQPLNPNSLFK
jgi:formamidopyrimidine-DNA glycosylase